MNFKKMVMVSVLAISSLSMMGCSSRVADLTFATTKNIDLNDGHFVEGKRVSGEDTRSIVIIFPTGNPSVKESADKAIGQDRCAVGLSDVVVDSSFWYIPYIYGEATLKTTGNLVIDKNKEGC